MLWIGMGSNDTMVHKRVQPQFCGCVALRASNLRVARSPKAAGSFLMFGETKMSEISVWQFSGHKASMPFLAEI